MPEISVNLDSTISIRLHIEEAELLRRLSGEMRSLLKEADDTDAVVARLFPDAYDSPQDSEAFKDLVGRELKSDKLRALEELERTIGTNGEVDAALGTDSTDAWLTAINDMRLAIGTRLDVDEALMSAEPDESDPRTATLSLLHWLGWVQESILAARAKVEP